MSEVRATTIKSNEIQQLVDWLASYGLTEEGGVTRLLYSKEWVQAQQALKQKMEEAGLKTYFDYVGNLFGRMEGTTEKDSIILAGSHVDTVVQGGKYDGAYGILASFLAMKRLLNKYGAPKKTIEIVSLCEEEGSRFPLTFWGSKNITGEYSEKAITQIVDNDGISFAQAMQEAGFPLSAYTSKKRTDIQHFVEIHIEQGAILEKNNIDIGLVSHIVGQKRFTIIFDGECNHAGTTSMGERKDAMVCAANAISQLTSLAIATSPSLRVTVGQLNAWPNVSNVVAGNVKISLDVRHHESEILEDYCQKALQFLQSLANDSGIQLTVEKYTDISPVGLDVQLHEVMKEKLTSKKIKYMTMVSGAGHDAQVFGGHIPTTLLFIPSHNGISHSPLEFTEAQDLENGVAVLMEYLYKLAY